MQGAQQQEKEFRRPLVYIPSQFSVSATSASNLCMEVNGNVSHGTKRKSDEDNDTVSIDELQATLLNTCISKLSTTMAKGSRHKRTTLRHSVLIHNMLRSLEFVSKSQNVELQSHRARITARRPSADSHPPSTTDFASSSSVELSNSSGASKQQQLEAFSSPQKHQQSLEHQSSWKQEQHPELFASPWEPQHQLELLPSSVDTGIDNSEVMSSPTATFCPLLTVKLTAEQLDNLQSTLALETLDISGDYSYLYNTDLNFFEPSLPFYKTAEISSSQ